MMHPVHSEQPSPAERLARFFGTTRYLVMQTCVVLAWLTLNIVGASLHWDPYPFILLNLAFSLQSAYAAPLILLAQNTQKERDDRAAHIDHEHNVTNLQLTQEIHAHIVGGER